MRRFLTFDDVGLIPKFNTINSRLHTKLSQTFGFGLSYETPWVPSNMDTVISKNLASVMNAYKGMTIHHRFDSLEKRAIIAREYPGSFISIGLQDEPRDILKTVGSDHQYFCVDVAHAHAEYVGKYVKEIKGLYPKSIIIAGNVCTPEGYEYLSRAGANIIKVGIGPGAACSTRMVTGFGIPQFSAIQICSQAKNRLKVAGKETVLMADGGIRNSRDAILSLAAGADLIMIGNLFAKTFESSAPKYVLKGDEYKKIDHIDENFQGKVYSHYRGQASSHFQKEVFGGVKKGTVPEGIDFFTPCSGSAKKFIEDMNGALRSALTYAGAETIQEFQASAEFFECNSSYMQESKPRENQQFQTAQYF